MLGNSFQSGMLSSFNWIYLSISCFHYQIIIKYDHSKKFIHSMILMINFVFPKLIPRCLNLLFFFASLLFLILIIEDSRLNS